MQVNRDFSCRDCTFSYRDRAAKRMNDQEKPWSAVLFNAAHVADFVLDGSTFDTITDIDFTKLQADLISIDRVSSLTPTEPAVHQMIFKSVSPLEHEKLKFLLSNYDAEFSTNLENWYRAHGYADQADNIFIAGKRAERRQKCP